MPSTEEQVKNIILKHNGAYKQQIGRELNFGLDYIDFICRGLERKGEISFLGGFWSIPKSSKKIPPKIHHSVKETSFSLSDIPELAADVIAVLKKEGYATIESLADAPIAKLMQTVNLKVHEAAKLINHSRKMLGIIKNEEVVEQEPSSASAGEEQE